MKLKQNRIIKTLFSAKDVSIKVKILLPFLVFLTIPFITIVIIGNYYCDKKLNNYIDDIAQDKYEQIQTDIAQESRRAYDLSSMLASIKPVRDAYKAYHNDSLSRYGSSMTLQYSAEDIFNRLLADYDIDYKFQFYIPPATSFLRSWSEERLDDLSDVRPSLLRVSENKSPVQGIEIGYNGIMMRGIVPILSRRRKMFYGSVETMLPLKNIIKNINSPNEEFAIYARKNEIETKGKQMATRDSLAIDTSDVTTDDFVVMDFSSRDFKFSQFNNAECNAFINSNKKYTVLKTGQNANIYYRLKNFTENAIGVIVFQQDLNKYLEANAEMRRIELLVFIGYLLLGGIVIVFITAIIISPLRKLSGHIDKLKAGDFKQKLQIRFYDEIGKIIEKVNTLALNLNSYITFTKQINEGNFDSNFEPFSKQDTLGNNLMQLRDNLKTAREEEQKRQQEDIKRNWVNEGRSRINEIIRSSSSNIEQLTDEALKEVINYMEANQGAIFVYYDQNSAGTESAETSSYLNLEAIYAYNHKKYESAHIYLGEGLVGMSAQDKITIYRTDIPDHFVRIRSGTGEANPSTLVIVPMVRDNNIIGVIELASFKTYNDYQIRFLEEAAETIGSAISNLRISRRTEKLLEQSRKQAEELTAQEQEMRENLKALQEQLREYEKKNQETEGLVYAINNSFIRANFDLEGNLKFAGAYLLNKFRYLEAEIAEFDLSSFIEIDENFNKKWEKLISNGEGFEHIAQYATRKSAIWLNGIFVPLYNTNNEITEILFLAFDIDNEKRKCLTYEYENNAFNKNLIKTVYNTEGDILETNYHYYELLGFSGNMGGKGNIFTMLSQEGADYLKGIWEKALDNITTNSLEKFDTVEGNSVWLKGIYIPVKSDNMITKIMFIATDVTDLISEEAENKFKEI